MAKIFSLRYRRHMKKGILALLFLFATLPAWAAHSITLTWQLDSAATGGYNVYRGTASGGPYTMIGSAYAGTISYVDTSGTGNVQYFYVVTALDTATPADESHFSNEATAVFLAGVIPPPIDLQAVSN